LTDFEELRLASKESALNDELDNKAVANRFDELFISDSSVYQWRVVK
jgi:hypothetical protein